VKWPGLLSVVKVADVRSEKMVAEGGDNSGTRERGTSAVKAATKQRLVKL
jgi:hypothetical protein